MVLAIHVLDLMRFLDRLLDRDLIGSVQKDRQPVLSGEDGRMALETITSVHASAISGAIVLLPLANRTSSASASVTQSSV